MLSQIAISAKKKKIEAGKCNQAELGQVGRRGPYLIEIKEDLAEKLTLELRPERQKDLGEA